MAEHRRKMQALGRVAETAGRVASSGELRRLQPVPPADATGIAGLDDGADGTTGVDAPPLIDEGVVVSLAAARARRAGHPAGSNRR